VPVSRAFTLLHVGSRVIAKYEELRYRDNYETDHGGIEAGFGYSMTFILA